MARLGRGFPFQLRQPHFPIGAAAAVPVNTAAPAVTGTTVVGSVLSTTNGSWTNTPTGFTYAWQRDNFGGGSYSAISGATSSTYTLVDADDACQIECIVTASNGAGNSSPATSNVLGPVSEPAPVNSVAPAVTGTTVVGSTLSSTTGTFSHMGGHGATFTYQWQRDAFGSGGYTNISGATASSYVLVDADDACHIECVVKATNTGGNASATSNAAGTITEPAPTNSVAPTIAGSTVEGNTLTVTNTGTWAHMAGHSGAFTYQWQRDNTGGGSYSNITGQTSSGYTTGGSDLGCNVRCVVKGTNSGGNASANSNAIGLIFASSFTVIDPNAFGATRGLMPLLCVEIDFTNDPTNPTRVWTDVTKDIRSLQYTLSGRNDPTQETQTGNITATLNNRTGNYTPSNTSGPYYPNVKQTRWLRVRAQWGTTIYNRWMGVVTFAQNWPEAGKDAIAAVTGYGGLGLLNVFDLGGNDFPVESSDSRVGAVCALLPLPTNLDPGASELVDSGTITVGTTALSHLQDVELTENGRLFDDAGGTIVFQSRHYRLFNSGTSLGTIGDAAGQIPYTDQAALTADDTSLWNVAVCTPSGGTAETWTNTGSTTAHFARTLTRDILSADQNEALALAQYLVYFYGEPSPKFSSGIVLKPVRTPSTWPLVLSLTNSNRVTFVRGAVSPISQDGYVEQLSETIKPSEAWDVSVQLSAITAIEQERGWILGDSTYGVLGSTTVLTY